MEEKSGDLEEAEAIRRRWSEDRAGSQRFGSVKISERTAAATTSDDNNDDSFVWAKKDEDAWVVEGSLPKKKKKQTQLSKNSSDRAANE